MQKGFTYIPTAVFRLDKKYLLIKYCRKFLVIHFKNLLYRHNVKIKYVKPNFKNGRTD